MQEEKENGWWNRNKKLVVSGVAHFFSFGASITGGVSGIVTTISGALGTIVSLVRDHFDHDKIRKDIHLLYLEIDLYNAQRPRDQKVQLQVPRGYNTFGLNQTSKQTACSYGVVALNLSLAATCVGTSIYYNLNPKTEKGW